MFTKNIKNVQNKILIVGPIYSKIEKLEKIKEIINDYELIILNGNLFHPNVKEKDLEKCIYFIDNLNKLKNIIYNLGNYDLMLINKKYELPNNLLEWFKTKSNSIELEFVNNFKIFVVNGGINNNINKNNIYNNIEVSFIEKINEKPWQNFYGGIFGYVISNNPLTLEKPIFYRFSAQIGNLIESNVTYAQEVDKYGLKNTISL